MVERNVRDTMGKTSRPLSDSNTISRARNRAAENHRAAENLWGQSASQRAGVANSLEKPASLVSKQKQSYEVDRERKRQLINTMVRPEAFHYERTKSVLRCASYALFQLGQQGGDKGDDCSAPRHPTTGTTGTPSWSHRHRSAALVSSRFEAGAIPCSYLWLHTCVMVPGYAQL